MAELIAVLLLAVNLAGATVVAIRGPVRPPTPPPVVAPAPATPIEAPEPARVPTDAIAEP